MFDFTLFSDQTRCCSLTFKRPWPVFVLALLAFLCCMVGTESHPNAFAQGLPAAVLPGHLSRRFLHLHGAESQKWSVETLQLKLERRRPADFDDRMVALRAAIHSDQVRRDRMVSRLQRRLLAQGGGIAPGAGPTNGSSSSGHKAGLASLNVISGSSVGSGEYFATMWVGTPPQKLYLIADTGSDLTWVKCSSSPSSSASARCATAATCNSASMNQTFYPAVSSSFSSLSCLSSQCAAWFFPPTCDGLSRHCKFSYSYTDQSFTSGSLAFESITLGKSVQANLVVGCGQQYAGQNFDKAGGVVGLGQGPFSLASQLAAQSASYSNKFSYCLADFFGPSSISGSLAFGESAFQTTPEYTPLIQNPFLETFYYVGVQEVKVDGVALAIPAEVWEIDGQGSGGTIVDSGTTLAQFAQPAYEVIRASFRQSIHYPVAESLAGLDLCYNVDGVPNPRFPEFAIIFHGNLVFQPPQDNYFTSAAPGVKCLAMQEVPPRSFSVVGNLLQQNYHIEFDRLHNRLGLAPADCAKLPSS